MYHVAWQSQAEPLHNTSWLSLSCRANSSRSIQHRTHLWQFGHQSIPEFPRFNGRSCQKKHTISFANRNRMRCSTPRDISKPRSTTQERCGIKTHPCRSEIKLCVSTSQSDDLPNCSLWKIHRNHVFPNVLFKQSFPKCCHSGRGGRLARLWARLLRELHSNVTDEAIEAGCVSHHPRQVTSQAKGERRR